MRTMTRNGQNGTTDYLLFAIFLVLFSKKRDVCGPVGLKDLIALALAKISTSSE